MSATPVWLSAISELPVPSLVPGKEEGMGRIGVSSSFSLSHGDVLSLLWCTETREREGARKRERKKNGQYTKVKRKTSFLGSGVTAKKEGGGGGGGGCSFKRLGKRRNKCDHLLHGQSLTVSSSSSPCRHKMFLQGYITQYWWTTRTATQLRTQRFEQQQLVF